MKNYELFWKEIHIGSLTERNWDMRSSGDILFHFNFGDENSDSSLLTNFIKHSIKASDYLEKGDMTNFNIMCEEELKYLDLINSSDWYLINESGTREKILCPLFHGNNEITWQTDIN